VAVGETLCVPETAFVPDHPLLAVQVVVLVEFQVSVADCPEFICVGEAIKVSVGVAGGGGGGGVVPLPVVRDTSSMMSVPLLEMSW
jgi:hypothetical protein